MPGTLCAVASCRNSQLVTRTNIDCKRIIYHKFPRDPILKKEWELRCDRDYVLNTRHTRICSEHFISDDYVRDLKAELLNVPPKLHLKPDAIPSVNLGPKWCPPEQLEQHIMKHDTGMTIMEIQGPFDNQTISLAYANQNEVEKMDVNTTEEQLIQNIGQYEIVTQSSVMPNKIAIPLNQTNSFLEVVPLNEFELLMNELEIEKRNNAMLRAKLEKTEEGLNLKTSTVILLRKELNMLRQKIKKQSESHDKLVSELHNMFTENQIKLLTSKQKRVNWTDEDMSAALTLRYLGKRTYIYLREKLNYPLPSFSTLDRWAASPRVQHEIEETKKATAKIEEELKSCTKKTNRMSCTKKTSRIRKKVIIKDKKIIDSQKNETTTTVEEIFAEVVDPSNGGEILIPLCAIHTDQGLVVETIEQKYQ